MPNRFRLHPLLIAAAAALAFASSARAAPVYDNLGSSTDGSDPLFSYGPLADSFSTGATSVALDRVLLSLTSLGAGYGGMLSVLLLADSANAPAAVLATLGSLPFDAVSTAAFGSYAFSPTASLVLDASTRYWVELVGSGPNAIQWSWSNDLTALGTAGEYSASGAFGVAANDALVGPYQMAVLTAPVPEPASYALTATGLLAMLAAGRAQRGTGRRRS